MKVKKIVLCILLSLALTITFIPVISFAQDGEADELVSEEVAEDIEKTIANEDNDQTDDVGFSEEMKQQRKEVKPNGNKNPVTKKMTEGQLSGEKASQLETAFENLAPAHSASYANPVIDNYVEPWIMVYYPEPGASYYLGSTMYVDYDVYDVWEYYYTRPVTGIFDKNDNLKGFSEGGIADVDAWTGYEGDRYLAPSIYPPGTYEFVVFCVPCDEYGNYVDGWDTWDNIPVAIVSFKIVCPHSWNRITNAAGLHKNGNRYDKCSICKATRNYAVLPGWANYYVKGLKVKKAKKAFTVKWKKQSKKNLKKFNGYQIRYSTAANMSGAKFATAGKKSKSKKIKKLQKKTTYYVQVRTFTKTGAGTFYSKWSPTKKVKTK